MKINTEIFALCNVLFNAILATPVKNVKDESTVSTFKDNIAYLKKGGFKPFFNIIDDVAPKAVKTYLEEEKISIHMVEPNNHRMNAAECVIQ